MDARVRQHDARARGVLNRELGLAVLKGERTRAGQATWGNLTSHSLGAGAAPREVRTEDLVFSETNCWLLVRSPLRPTRLLRSLLLKL